MIHFIYFNLNYEGGELFLNFDFFYSLVGTRRQNVGVIDGNSQFLILISLEVVIMKNEQLLERIILNPKIMVGKPVIKGTRLTVDFILNLLAHGSTADVQGDVYGRTGGRL